MGIYRIFTRLVGVILLVGVLTSVTSCIAPACYHEWVDATCESPQYCTICNRTHGKKLVHVGGQAACNALAICEHCGKEYGEYKEHTFKKTLSENTDEYMHYFACTVCSADSEGEEHTWNVEAATYADDKACTVCGYVIEESLPHEHIGGEANCESGAVCELCGREYTDPLGHTFDEATWPIVSSTKHYHSCTVCGEHDEGEEHNWVDTDYNDAVCDVCQASYSDFFVIPEESN